MDKYLLVIEHRLAWKLTNYLHLYRQNFGYLVSYHLVGHFDSQFLVLLLIGRVSSSLSKLV